MKKHPPLLFLDTETLGLGAAPIWECSGFRVVDGKVQNASFIQMFVEHDELDADGTPWVDSLPPSFTDDYQKRFIDANPLRMSQRDAVNAVRWASRDKAIVCGSNPSFDMERLEKMAIDNGVESLEGAWHYHAIDVPTLAHGWLLGKGIDPAPPWKSDFLSQACGVNPKDFDRHTAMGDCKWSWELWKAITS